jgi:hypothetical protein
MNGGISSDVVQALVAIGYLQAGDAQNTKKVTRAVTRFQRHAARPYRMPQPDAGGADLYGGQANGNCDPLTELHVKRWIEKKWVIPVGRFPLRTLNIGAKPVRLRPDASEAWEQIVLLADKKGAILRGEYGDSARAVRPTDKVGASRYSFHYAGRAVDIPQQYKLSADHRYFITQDPSGGNQYWRIYCKTEKQDGGQGELIEKGTVKHYSFGEKKEVSIPQGYYVDLTDVIESSGKFERIKAQGGWEKSYNRSEWWHFQYKLDKQPTFLDEMELIGYTEDFLRKSGWPTDEMLDHAPG